MTTNNANSSFDFIWLYSSAFGFGWWKYNNDDNVKIINMFKDHCKRKNILINDVVCDTHNITCENVKKCVENTHEYDTESNSDFDSDSDSDSDLIDFNEICDDDINEYTMVDYTIHANNEDYKIDFDAMKQINKNNNSKMRNIKLIKIVGPGRSEETIEHILKSINVKGTSGKKFD